MATHTEETISSAVVLACLLMAVFAILLVAPLLFLLMHMGAACCDGFQSALAAGVPREKSGILVDEQFGTALLRDAAAEGVVTACPSEKSGQHEFDFEYGEDFAKHIESIRPTFCKVLVRYNPEGDRVMNQRQAGRLRQLSDYLARSERSRFMFELLVPAEKAQLDKLRGDNRAYERELRPRLMVGAIEELQGLGVEPDVWKGIPKHIPVELHARPNSSVTSARANRPCS
jgi:myo-inositol catabolism protein IolC